MGTRGGRAGGSGRGGPAQAWRLLAVATAVLAAALPVGAFSAASATTPTRGSSSSRPPTPAEASGGGANSVASGTNVVSTLAGGVRPGPSTALDTVIDPGSMASTGSTLYVSDQLHSVVRAVDLRTGLQRVVAGNGTTEVSGDGGPAVTAGIGSYASIAADGDGRLYLATGGRLRRVAADGTISTVLPSGVEELLDTDTQGRVLMRGTGSCVVLRLEADDTVTTFAGTGTCGAGGNGGPATAANLGFVVDVAVDPATGGVMILAGGALRLVAPNGTISLWSIPPAKTGSITYAASGSLLATEWDTGTVVALARSGVTSTIAGGGSSLAEGVAAADADLVAIGSLLTLSDGSLAVSWGAKATIGTSFSIGAVRRLAGGTVSTIIGLPALQHSVAPQGPGQGQLTETVFDLSRTPEGDLLAVDALGLRRIRPDGTVTSIPTVDNIASVAAGEGGVIYYLARPPSDLFRPMVHRLAPDGQDQVIALAGSDNSQTNGEGDPALTAHLPYAQLLRRDGAGNLYVASPTVCWSGPRCVWGGDVRRIDADGRIWTALAFDTVTGSPGVGVSVWYAGTLAVAADGTLVYSTGYPNTDSRIYRTSPTGPRWIAGTPGGSAEDGIPAVDANVAPSSLAIGPSGEVYLSEQWAVRVIAADGTISTVVRNPSHAHVPVTEGGSAQAAGILPGQVVVLPDGTLGVADVAIRNPYFPAGSVPRVVLVSPAAAPSMVGAPVGVSGVGSVQVSWSPPVQSDLVVTGYVVEVSPSGGGVSVGQVTSTRIDGLVNGTAYSFRVTARSAAGLGVPSPWSVPVTPVAGVVPGAGFHAVTPFRVLDTRTPLGGLDGAVAAGAAWVTVAPSGGPGGVPASASAVVMNVAVTGGTLPSVLRVWPNGFPGPTAANLNFGAGETIANLVTVKVGSGGQVLLGNLHGSVHVIADVVGWYDDGSGGGDGFTGMTPGRLLDSRTDVGGWGSTPLGAGDANVRSLVVRGGSTGVPGTASSVALNVTVTGGSAGSYLQVFPTGAARPVGANINFGPGQTIPNLVVMKVGSGDRVSLFNAVGSTDVVVDVVGYFDPTVTGGRFHPVVPTRMIDSRDGTGGFSTPWPATPPATARTVTLAGVRPVPANATGIVMNTAVTEGTSASYLTVFPDGVTQPGTANVVFAAGQTIPNAALVGLGAGGGIQIANQLGSVQVVGDLDGYYAPT